MIYQVSRVTKIFIICPHWDQRVLYTCTVSALRRTEGGIIQKQSTEEKPYPVQSISSIARERWGLRWWSMWSWMKSRVFFKKSNPQESRSPTFSWDWKHICFLCRRDLANCSHTWQSYLGIQGMVPNSDSAEEGQGKEDMQHGYYYTCCPSYNPSMYLSIS